MKLVASLLLTTSLFAGSSFIGENQNSNSDLINYYNDGVYDTISQINKEISEGVNKEELKDNIGKVAILTPLQNVSTVNLIFYKTTAAKINLFNAMTVIDENGSPFLLWDLKQREVDSQFIIQKLTERNIPVTSKVISAENKFYREPVLIKDFIDKITHNIKNVDTKVVVVEKKAYMNEEIKAVVPVDVKEKTVYKQNIPENKEYQEMKINKEPIFNEVTFKENTLGVSRNLRMGKTGALFYKLSKIQKGVKVGQFTAASLRFEETENHSRYYIAYEEDNSQTEYLLYTEKKTRKTENTIKEESLNNQEASKKEIKKVEEKRKSTYKCDFKNIKMALNKDGKVIKIDSGNLFYNKVVNLEAVKKIDSNYLLTNSIGLPEILLNEKYLNNDTYCSKVE